MRFGPLADSLEYSIVCYIVKRVTEKKRRKGCELTSESVKALARMFLNLNQATKDKVLSLACEGKPTRYLVQAIGCKHRQFYEILRRDAAFRTALSQARAFGYEALAENVLTLVDDDALCSDPQTLRLKADNMKWFLSCVEPTKYGQRQTLTVESVSIGDALTEAKTRALRVINPPDPPAPEQLEAPNPFD